MLGSQQLLQPAQPAPGLQEHPVPASTQHHWVGVCLPSSFERSFHRSSQASNPLQCGSGILPSVKAYSCPALSSSCSLISQHLLGSDTGALWGHSAMEIVGLCQLNTGIQSWRCASSPGLFPLFHLHHLSASQQCNRGHGRNPSPCAVPTLLPCSGPGKDSHKPRSPAGSPP